MQYSIEKNFLLVLLGGITIVLFVMFKPFLLSIIVAFLLASSHSLLYKFLQRFFKGRKILCASIMTIILAILFVVPFLYLITKASQILTHIDDATIATTQELIKAKLLYIDTNIFHFKQYISDDIFDISNLPYFKQGAKSLLNLGLSISQYSLNFMSNMMMILIFYFIFIAYGSSLYKYINELLPINNQYSDQISNEILGVTGVVFYSILTTALLEAILFGGFVSFFGFDGLMFGILYGFASLIPVVGGIIMWLPILIYSALYGDIYDGVAIALYSVIVISLFADTIIKPIIIKYINQINATNTQINEMLIFFSIIAGLSGFGFWGMIIGPTSVVFFIAILKLLKVQR